jgi:hypothetical protein
LFELELFVMADTMFVSSRIFFAILQPLSISQRLFFTTPVAYSFAGWAHVLHHQEVNEAGFR